MGKQPTNGPYHWGNGPQPGSGKAKGKVKAIAIALVAVPMLIIGSLVAYLIIGNLA